MEEALTDTALNGNTRVNQNLTTRRHYKSNNCDELANAKVMPGNRNIVSLQ